MTNFKNENFFVKKIGNPKQSLRIVWLHGWGHSHAAMLPLTQLFEDSAINCVVDLPGFGSSPMPTEEWGTKEYGDCIADWLQKLPQMPTIIVGHSFGCKVAMQIAANHEKLVNSLVLIGAAGLKKKRSIFFKMKAFVLKTISRCIKIIEPTRIGKYKLFKFLKEKIVCKLGSADYREAGKMRPILVKSIQEDLNDLAQKISQPTLLIFGSDDIFTPPEFGKRYNSLIPNSKFVEIPGLNHNSVLFQGRYQVQSLIMDFLKEYLA